MRFYLLLIQVVLFQLFACNIWGAKPHIIRNVADVTANNDIAKFFQNLTVNIPVLYNDFGLLTGIRSLTVTQMPKNGTIKVNADNTISYTPKYNFIGTDEFVYEVCVYNGGCGSATVFIEVMDFDYKPSLVNDTIVLIQQSSDVYEFDILGNDSGIEDEPIEITLLTELSHGRLNLNSNNTVTPTFKQYFVGIDSVMYRVCDKDGDCGEAWIFFNIKPIKEQPSMFVPTGISPNGDGFNDYFFVPDLDRYTQLEIRIFTQWGNLVYSDNNYNNRWDGRANTGMHKGNILPNGTYYYNLIIVSANYKIDGFIYIGK